MVFSRTKTPLLFLVLLATLTTAALGQTRVGFYSTSCPRVETIIQSVVQAAQRSTPGVPAGLIRMHFHDCFVNGCDASILITGPSSERTAPPNSLLRGYEIINTAKTQLEAACPGVVSCADILAIAARDSVLLAGGIARWNVPTGRRDGLVSRASDTTNLPAFNDPVNVQIRKFAEKGLNTQDLVTLSGTTVMTSTDDQRGIWEIDVRAQQQNLLHEMNDPSMFYNDQFPQIPDFPCMSSSSSSSSNPAPAKPISSATTTSSASSGSSSTSSAASWAVLKSEYVTEEEEAEGEDHLEELRINRRKRSHREEPVPVMTTAPAVEAVLLFLPTVVVSLPKNETTNFRPLQELKKLNRIRNHLKKINKQPVKTIHEPPLERPKGDNSTDETIESFQLWLQSNDPCPEGTIPIRRTTENDILRASSLKRFGRKNIRGVRRDTSSGGHEHAVAFVNGDQYYGAKASINDGAGG